MGIKGLVTVILPAHNEEQAITPCLKGVFSYQQDVRNLGFDLEVLVVNNACTDQTSQLARQAGAIVVDEPRKGYGSALKRGLAEAKGDILILMDADCSYPPGMIVGMVAQIRDSDKKAIFTDRLSIECEGMTPANKFGNQFQAHLMHFLTGIKFTDSQSGMMAFRRSVLYDLLGQGSGMEFCQQTKVRIAKRHEFTEIPINYQKRVGKRKFRLFRDGTKNFFFQFFEGFRSRIAG